MDDKWITILLPIIDTYASVSYALKINEVYREDTYKVLMEQDDCFGNTWMLTEKGWLLGITADKKCNVYRHY